jgi:structural maintenance of chromosome 2
VDILNGQLSGLDFKFSNPENKFDRSKVKGVIAKLMTVTDPAMATALEVVAGGKLYQVVVDTADTGKLLLAKGKLQKRVTIVPLNKIDGRGVSAQTVAAATKVSGGDARLALSLVTYDEDLQSVMSYVFGKAFVCRDTATARAVAFDNNVLTNCVTVEGDLLNPGGLLTGGSRNGGVSVLAKLHALQQAELDLESLQKTYADAKAVLIETQALSKQASSLESIVDQSGHALTIVKEKLQGSESAQVVAKVVELEASLKNCQDESAEAIEAKAELTKKQDVLKAEISSFASEREGRLALAKKAVAECKQALTDARGKIKSAESEMTAAAVARSTNAAEQSSIDETIAAADCSVEFLESELKELEGVVLERNAQLCVVSQELTKRREEAKEVHKAQLAVQSQKAKIAKRGEEDEISKKQLLHKISRAEKDANDSKENLARLLDEHPWIESESNKFGVAGSEYDFTAKDPVKATAELLTQEERQHSVAKRINKKGSCRGFPKSRRLFTVYYMHHNHDCLLIQVTKVTNITTHSTNKTVCSYGTRKGLTLFFSKKSNRHVRQSRERVQGASGKAADRFERPE